MKIYNAIVHELIKKVDQTEHADKRIRPAGVFDKESQVLIDFSKSIEKSYSKKPKALGRFDDNQVEYTFQSYLKSYIDTADYSPNAFITFTTNAMDRLVIQAKPILKATGGFIVFLHYEENGSDYLMILLLSQKHVFNIEDLDIKDLEAVDIETLRYAVRIELTEWINAVNKVSDAAYLSFLRGTAEKVSNYFQSFIGCTDIASPKMSTSGMIEACRKYMTEVMNLDVEQRRSKDSEILSYCVEQRRVNEHVSLNVIANIINPVDAESFVKFVDDNNIFFPEFFDPDPTELKKLKRYEYKSKKWSISFEHSAYQNGQINYNKENNTIQINDVPKEFAENLDLGKADG